MGSFAFPLALYVVWLVLLFWWGGPARHSSAKRLFGLTVILASSLWLLMILRRDGVQASPLLWFLINAQFVTTMSLPITLSFWLFGPASRITLGNGVGRVLLASFAAIWTFYLIFTYMIGGQFSLRHHLLEYVAMGVLLPLLAVVAGYFGLRRGPI